MDLAVIFGLLSGIVGGMGGWWLALAKLRLDNRKLTVEAGIEQTKLIFQLVADLQEERAELQEQLELERARLSKMKSILRQNNIQIPD